MKGLVGLQGRSTKSDMLVARQSNLDLRCPSLDAVKAVSKLYRM